MALSFKSTKKAYSIFNELNKLISLEISSFPEDMEKWEENEQKNPPLNKVLGWGQKIDGGWESISFFIKEPTEELKNKFEELKRTVPNSSISGPYFRNKNIWCFGWF